MQELPNGVPFKKYLPTADFGQIVQAASQGYTFETSVGEKIRPLGGVMYDGREHMIVFGLGDKIRKLSMVDTELPYGFDPRGLIGWERRIKDLPHLKDIVPIQLDTGYPTIEVVKPALASPSIITKWPYENPVTGEPASLSINERELLRALKGTEGGIKIFSGAELDDEVALVVEKRSRKERYGLVFLFHPEDAYNGENIWDSKSGFGLFLNNLITQYRELPGGGIHLDYLAKLDRGLSSNKIKVASEQQDLLRALVIASLRTQDGSSASLENQRRLDNLVEGLDDGWKSLLPGRRGEKNLTPQRTRIAEWIMQDAFRVPKYTPVEKPIWARVKNPVLSELRRTVGIDLGKSPQILYNDHIMLPYLDVLDGWLRSARNVSDLDEVKFLMDEIRGSALNRQAARNNLYVPFQAMEQRYLQRRNGLMASGIIDAPEEQKRQAESQVRVIKLEEVDDLMGVAWKQMAYTEQWSEEHTRAVERLILLKFIKDAYQTGKVDEAENYSHLYAQAQIGVDMRKILLPLKSADPTEWERIMSIV